MPSLVGSEMCIRDRLSASCLIPTFSPLDGEIHVFPTHGTFLWYLTTRIFYNATCSRNPKLYLYLIEYSYGSTEVSTIYPTFSIAYLIYSTSQYVVSCTSKLFLKLGMYAAAQSENAEILPQTILRNSNKTTRGDCTAVAWNSRRRILVAAVNYRANPTQPAKQQHCTAPLPPGPLPCCGG